MTNNGTKVLLTVFTEEGTLYGRECVAKQVLKINESAYKHMTDPMYNLKNVRINYWRNMTKNQRLKAHLNDITCALKGSSYSFETIK